MGSTETMFTGADHNVTYHHLMACHGEICLELAGHMSGSVPGSALSITTTWGGLFDLANTVNILRLNSGPAYSPGSGVTVLTPLVLWADLLIFALDLNCLGLIRSDRKLSDIKLGTLHTQARRCIRSHKYLIYICLLAVRLPSEISINGVRCQT